MIAADNKNAFRDMMADAGANGTDKVALRALQAVRAHLGMEVAYVSEFVGDQSVFREVDAPGLEQMIKPGDSQSLDDVYCRHILAGRLPEIIPDTSAEPLAMSLAITSAVPIRSHMSVPIRLRDGRVHGMFCCLGFQPNSSLNTRDLQMMKVFADLTAFEIDRDLEVQKVVADKTTRIQNVMAQKDIAIHYQPIFGITSNRVVGFESLSRFTAEPKRPPNEWFAEAAEVGLAIELEMTAIRLALSALPSLPDDIYLAINVSPETVLSGVLARDLQTAALPRIMLEITEHAAVSCYDSLLAELRPLRERGMRLAVDDAGAGYSGLQHILQLQPDLIKLDMALTRHVDLDPARKALAAALISFARDTNCTIVAEGVETASELSALRAIGASAAQGYFLGRPMPLDSAMALLAAADDSRLRA